MAGTTQQMLYTMGTCPRRPTPNINHDQALGASRIDLEVDGGRSLVVRRPSKHGRAQRVALSSG